MNDDKEKNISLILKQPDDDDHVSISFEAVFSQLRRFLSLWIVLAAALGAVCAGIAMMFDTSVNGRDITALICYNYSGIENGLAPDGSVLDVNKIKSPNIIDEALSNINIPGSAMEKIRRNIVIKGVIPDEASERISLYKDIYKRTGSMDAANALLNMDYNCSYYTVTFKRADTGYDFENGKNILDSVLSVYQAYFFRMYGYNEAPGNSLSAVDYRTYDYPAAIDIFHSALDDFGSYVNNLSASDTVSFRSSKTGYNFDDLKRNIDILRDTDLNALSAYISVNSAVKDKKQLISYYEYKIEELGREAEVKRSELDAISQSIASYNKDTVMVFGKENGESSEEYLQISKKYDDLVDRKLAAQNEYSAKQKKIEYYRTRLKDIEASGEGNISDAEKQQIESRMEKLYGKINSVIEVTEKTADDYYENVVFENAFNILVPATGNDWQVRIGGVAIVVGIAEAVLLLLYLGYCVITGIRIEKNDQKQKGGAL